jgi:hypothetical protein
MKRGKWISKCRGRKGKGLLRGWWRFHPDWLHGIPVITSLIPTLNGLIRSENKRESLTRKVQVEMHIALGSNGYKLAMIHFKHESSLITPPPSQSHVKNSRKYSQKKEQLNFHHIANTTLRSTCSPTPIPDTDPSTA